MACTVLIPGGEGQLGGAAGQVLEDGHGFGQGLIGIIRGSAGACTWPGGGGDVALEDGQDLDDGIVEGDRLGLLA